MTVYTNRIIVIVPVSMQAQANSIAAGMDPLGNSGSTFYACELSANGLKPTEYYACDTIIEKINYDALPNYSSILGTTGRVYDLTDGMMLMPLGVAWTAGNCKGWTAQQCFSDLGIKVIPK